MKKIAIIPLKSDSKRFPDKNFACINGTPLLINTMCKLNEAGIDTIVISTDKVQRVYNTLKDKRTLDRYDNYFVLDRLNNTMGNARTESIIPDIISDLEKIYYGNEDYIIVIAQVTSPLWHPDKLKSAFDKLNFMDGDSIISTSPDYKPNGCFYVFKKSTFLEHGKIFTSNIFLIPMSWAESVDIDYEHELSIASALERGNYV